MSEGGPPEIGRGIGRGELPRRGLRRAGFWVYAVVLFTATHWPRLEIQSGVIERPDLLIHIGAFGVWAALLSLSGLLGRPARGVVALRVIAVGLVYAAIDESSQALPIVQRHAGVDDYLANAAGIVLGAAAAWLTARRLAPPVRPSAGGTPR